MKRPYIENIQGQLQGYIDIDDDGRKSAKNVHGQRVEGYQPSTDLTTNVKKLQQASST